MSNTLMATSTESPPQQLDLSTAEYIDELNQLAQLKLSDGNVKEAQELFQEVASLRQVQLSAEAQEAAQQHVEDDACPGTAGSGGEDDWETSWSKGLDTLQAHKGATASSQPKGKADQPQVSSGSKAAHSKQQEAFDEEDDQGHAATSGALMGFDHVVEVYGLTSSIKTSHLQTFVDTWCGDMKIKPEPKWVDDNHALLVCPNVTTATDLLALGQEEYQLRPFSEASQASKQMPYGELMPPRPRPKTTAAVAKKLLSHALNMPGLRDRTAEKELAEQRKAAKDARRQKQAHSAAVWGDDD